MKMINNKNISEDSGKSLEELAREAMNAIKKSKRNEQDKEERAYKEEIIAKEAVLKHEVEQKIKRKLLRLKKEESKKPKIDEQDHRLMINWSNPDQKGFTYEGRYNDKYTFRIKKGLYLYHLFIEDKKLITETWQRSICTSVDLFSLKEKADKILKESIKKVAKTKKIIKIKKHSNNL